MTKTARILPVAAHHPDGPENLRVAVLAYRGLCTFEFGIAAEVFGLPRPEYPRWYRCEVVAIEKGPLAAVGGIRVQADGGLERLARAGTIVVPGWRGADQRPPEALLQALRRAHARGTRLVTLCSGVFVLAAAGLLDGRRATTHWRYADRLRAMYPAIRVMPDVLYVDDGDILTAAGSAAGLDLCVHVVRRDWGPRIANEVARRLVIAPHRDGGQAQFVPRPIPDEAHALAPVLDWARAHLDGDLGIPRLAHKAGLSMRTFARRFVETTGLTPAEWVIRARVDRARELLEATRLPVERVATGCGFGAADTLRLHFRNRLGVSPAAYRRRFQHAA
ncbi:MAG: transcriptional regulator FtrA [Alphaproteobacteria bacterium]|nr:transcriptional regulator FtrA [Alphaproteobacteria bacterium]